MIVVPRFVQELSWVRNAAVAASVLMLLASPSWGQTPDVAEHRRVSLSNLDGVAFFVTVHGSGSNVVNDVGIRQSELRNQVDSQLRNAGITVYESYDDDEFSSYKDPLPLMNLRIRVDDVSKQSVREGLYVYRVEVAVGQLVTLTSGKRIYAQTYSTKAAMGFGGEQRLKRLRRYARSRLNEFIIDWLSAHADD